MASFTFSRFNISLSPLSTAMAAISSDSCTGNSRYFSPCFTFSMACLSPSTVKFTCAVAPMSIVTAATIVIKHLFIMLICL